MKVLFSLVCKKKRLRKIRFRFPRWVFRIWVIEIAAYWWHIFPVCLITIGLPHFGVQKPNW